ncbi:DNA-directed RNA polymerase subunit beta' [Frankliniella fusca]|uniref:DNA-directed RNA polymerase subunit beta n=1 Tax=Frankliniella fusca TaxID=407009 RepID=A0AAE1LD64_9NEOP|nr:DNA-directed RNA polymerase subunit beta' [Frankliniella fusca]KAK3914389.1 DNA-directed RNA polymerase subunit beta' [Frankliniella fusca]
MVATPNKKLQARAIFAMRFAESANPSLRAHTWRMRSAQLAQALDLGRGPVHVGGARRRLARGHHAEEVDVALVRQRAVAHQQRTALGHPLLDGRRYLRAKRYSAAAALQRCSSPAWRTRKSEHCSGAPSILCGFHATESARARPARRAACFGLSRSEPPQHASTCSQTPRSRHTSATWSSGSTAPSTVVPAVAFTRSGWRPSRRACRTASRSAAGSMRPAASVATLTTLDVPSPSQCAPFSTEVSTLSQ